MESQHKNYNFTCEQSSCDYVKISPFEYQVTLKSAEHKDINYTWKPSKQNAVQNLEFQKDYSLESVSLLSQKQAENILNETIESQQEETIQEKIQKLKDKQTVHLRIEIDNNIYTFKKNNRELSLYQNEKKL
jgi:ribosomal protein L33